MQLNVNLSDGDFVASWQITKDKTEESVSIKGHTPGFYTVSEQCPNCNVHEAQYCNDAHEFDGGNILIDEDLTPLEYLQVYGSFFVVPGTQGSNLT